MYQLSEVSMTEEVNLNVKLDKALRSDLKAIAKDKDALFHPWLIKEFEKIVNRHKGQKK